ncbi:DUF6308 family protein [Streptomyces sp. NPDC088816]|uniref:DUF6308 family protein n=1 Tax=Streptomyces sp. NPDC088816 TaxID=3365906 RepID=UPI00380C3F5A
MVEQSMVRIGAFTVGLNTAEHWVRRFFDESNNRAIAASRGKARPYAYPVYDRFQAGSGASELSDGDFLAPALLNAGLSIRAVFNLQVVRSQLEEALAAIPVALTLVEAAAKGTHTQLLVDLFGVLDGPTPILDVGLTKLSKILHRKRPSLIPLYDSKVKACYCGTSSRHPVKPVSNSAPDGLFYAAVATCIARDLADQPDQWKHLKAVAPADVSLLRVFDVVAWELGASRRDV